jgi:hypothetical protein
MVLASIAVLLAVAGSLRTTGIAATILAESALAGYKEERTNPD